VGVDEEGNSTVTTTSNVDAINVLLDSLYNVLIQVAKVQIGGHQMINSMGYLPYAQAIKLLDSYDRVNIISENGRWISAHLIAEEE